MDATPLLKELPQATRSPERPIIIPRTDQKKFWWEVKGTFNPGVAEYKNQIILLYRAYDQFRISRLGIAHSKDGVEFEQYDHPVIDTNPNDPYERLGIEDARVTEMDGTYFVVHTSASYHPVGHAADVTGVGEHIPWRVRVGMHTTTDFESFVHWGILLPDIVAKNACLLPEKINGNYGLYYRERTDEGETLKLAYSQDFRQWSTPITIRWPQAHAWQSFKFGTGSPPLLTDEGYLMVYHAVDQQQVYRLGLILFDKKNPENIIWYSNPILEPTTSYEKDGYVPNVVYSCGALLRGEELWIYYGAADKVIGRAILPLKEIF